MLTATLFAVMLSVAPTEPCARPTGAVKAKASLELAAKVGPKDTVATVRFCVGVKDPKVRIGSYHGLITWDSTAARLSRVQKGKMGMRIENTTKAGVVDFAGAFPAGLDDTVALTLHLALAKPGKVPVLKLHMFELNAVSGVILTSQVRVSGYPSTVRTTPGPLKSAVATAQKNDSANASISNGNGSLKDASSGAPAITAITQSGNRDEVQAVIRGTGFLPTGNTVVFGRVELTNLPSADGGTMIRFPVPESFPSTSEVPPMKVEPGDYQVRVKNARGTSNAITFALKAEGRL